MTTNIPPGSGRTVQFEHQDTEDSCGAACAVMVLDAMAVAHPIQADLFTEIKSFTSKDSGRDRENWASSPDGLKDVLNSYGKPDYHFKLYANLRQSEIARRMVWTIFHYKTPCIALISSGIHWVVVYQFKKEGSPITDYDSFLVRDIQEFYVLDPFDEVPTEGTIDYQDWIDNIQNAERTGFWKDEYVALCDPDPGDKKNKNMSSNMKKRSGKESQGPLKEANLSSAADPNIPSGTDKPQKTQSKKPHPSPDLPITRIKTPGPEQGLIDDKTARAYSMWHLKKRDGFYDPTMFTRMMVNPGPGKPILVQGIDTKDFWYIVPFIEMNKKTGGVMRMNAKNAKFQEAAFAMHSEQPLTATGLSDQQITNLVIDKFGKQKGKITIEPILVWKPCVESYSRFLPFYKVKMGASTAYVRIDGKVYSRLSQRRLR